MVSPYQVKHKPTRRTSDTTRFLVLTVLFSLIVGGFVYAFVLREPVNSQSKPAPSLYPPIHAEDLGKTPKALKKKYPDLFLANDRYGNQVARHKLDNAQYTIWFVAENGEKQAFRIKALKKLPALDEADMLAFFAKLYGRPFDGQCSGKSTYAENNCQYKWWVRKSISLDLFSRHTSKKSVTLSAVTTDTYLATKHHKAVKSVLPVQ